MKINPHAAIRILDSVSFLNDQYGLTLNGMVTLSFTQLGLTTAREANTALTKLNEALADRLRRFQARWSPGYRQPFFFVYAHENVGTHGHHVHELLALPDGAHAGLDRWLRDWARRNFGPDVDPQAIDFRGRYHRDSGKAIEDQVRMVRYILKSSDDVAVPARKGEATSLHRILDIKDRNYSHTAPVAKPVGCSQNLARRARISAGFEWFKFIEDCMTDRALARFRNRQNADQLARQLRAINV